MIFQMMFAIITPALITGAFAERAKFSTFLVFMVLWATARLRPGRALGVGPRRLARPGRRTPTAGRHQGTRLRGRHRVHINAGVAALAAASSTASATAYGREPMEPHDITMVVVGACILWFGWFGFNAGSAGRGRRSGLQRLRRYPLPRRPRRSPGPAELVGLRQAQRRWRCCRRRCRPGGDYACLRLRHAHGRLAIGVGAGALCYFAVRLRAKIGLDDSLDVVGVHGVGGHLGRHRHRYLLRRSPSNPASADGLLAGGGFDQLGRQLSRSRAWRTRSS